MRRVVAVLAALALPLLAVGPASAEEPAVDRSAYFAATGLGGLGAPSPTVNEGDLRVSRSLRTAAPAGELETPSEVLSFAALLYRAPGVRASLELTLREGAVGTPDVQACATVGTDWEAGPNQPLDALQYDCSLATALGVLSEDGTTVAFSIDDRWQPEPGVWSIAVVPTSAEPVVTVPPVVPLPFSADFAQPEPGQFVTEAAFVLPGEPGSSDSGSFDPGSFGSGTGTGTTSGGGGAFLPGGGFTTPGGSGFSGGLGSTTVPPAVAGGALPDPQAAAPQSPVLAGAPRAGALRPASVAEDLSSGARIAALLALAGLCAAVGWASGQQRPGPQLIGGRARAAAFAAGAPVAEPAGRPRGIGRFEKVRDAAPRRLR